MDNDDWKLVREYVAENSERAFHELVRRYAGLVHASAFRQTGDAQLAQDVAQAVFTLLSRKARSLRPETVLSGWLFQTTRFVANRALRAEQRRRRREQEAFNMRQLQSGEDAWRQMAPVIDEAVGGLSADDREAILLRHFEGRTVREVGVALGISEEGAKKRLARALEKLRRILSRNGVALSTALLGATLSERAVGAVSDSLATALATGALKAEGGAGAVLVNECISVWRRWKAITIAGAGMALVAVVIMPAIYQRLLTKRDRQPTTIVQTTGATTSSDHRVQQASSVINPSLRQFALRAVDADSGAPVSNAPVVAVIWRNAGVETFENLATDESGVCQLAIPATSPGISVGVLAAGWTARYATWPSEGQSEIPSDYTLRLTRVTNSIGGVVRDSGGKPLLGADIFFLGNDFGDSAHRERARERFGFVRSIRVTQTDGDGRWSVSFVPPAHPGFSIEARHSKYADTSLVSNDRQGSLDDVKDGKVRELWSGRLVSTMQEAFTLTGRIIDGSGAPIPKARIQHGEQSEIFVTDDQGRFAVPKLEEGTWAFTVTADSFGPLRTNASIGATTRTSEVTVMLHPGAVLRLRVVDENGIEVPDAEVGLEQWGENRHDFQWRARTDFHGRIVWSSAPPVVEMELFARHEGFCYTRSVRVVADGAEHTIEIHRTLELYGRVVDAETGLPVSTFKALPGYGRDDRYFDASLRWFALESVLGSNGTFKLTFAEKEYPWQVRIRAEGYEDWTSEPLTNRIQDVIDIALRPARLENSVRGRVIGPGGSPAPAAQVALLTFEHNVVLRDRVFEGSKQWVIRADESGAFEFPPNREAHSVAAVNESGYVLVRLRGVREPIALRLEPWGRVEGMVEESAVGPGLVSVKLYDPAADNYQGRVRLQAYSAKPVADRQFVFENVPAGEFCVFVNSDMGVPYHHQTPVTVRPGETTQVVISEKPGTRITGRFTAPAGKSVDWRKDLVLVHFYADLPQAGQYINPGPESDRRRREFEFWTSPLGREHINNPRVYSGAVRADGSFTSTEPLPPGKYHFTTVFKDGSKTLSATRSVEVKDGGPPLLEFGEIQLQ